MTTEHNYTIKLHPWGAAPDKGVVGIDPVALYGYWERKDGSEGGGLWFSHGGNGSMELIDYDGAFELPAAVVAALRTADVILDETFN